MRVDTTGGPETLPVQVDGSDPGRQASLLSFFPNRMVARGGDTISFQLDTIGEPHVIALGTLVNTGLDALDAVGVNSVKEAFLLEPEELFKLPSIFGPPPSYTPEPQAAGQPCYLDSGDPPIPDACPKREQPDFDGTQSFYASGLLKDQETFEVPLSGDIPVGAYRFMCLIHRGVMTGAFAVVGDDANRPDAEEVAEQGQEEIEAALKNLEQPIAAAAEATPAPAVAGTMGKEIFEMGMTFGPRQAEIKAGESMSWSFNLCHTISFNPPPEAFGDLHRQDDGSARLNPAAYTPSKAPQPPELSFDPNTPAVSFDAGAWDGTGFFNSGGICSLAPGDVVYKLAFSQPGTYQLRCLFHPSMQAAIKVV